MDTSREKRREDELLKVAEQAADWLIALEEAGEKERVAFAEWIEESPLHTEMFLRATAVNQIGSLIKPEDRDALMSVAVTDDSHSNVVALEKDILGAPPTRAGNRVQEPYFPFSFGKLRNARKPSPLRLVASFASISIALAIWWYVAGDHAWQQYGTAIGEQRAVALTDGSVVYVNTDTRIDVRYSEHARDIRLVNGEALFKVEHDPLRPFRVHVDNSIVQAVGTQFNIYRGPAKTTVAVIEGVVQVSKDSDHERHARQPGKQKPERISAGQAVKLAKGGRIERETPLSIAQVTAWRQRRLVFEWEELGTIATEFNRYNRTPQIRVEGDSVRSRRYTAVFDADNPQTLLKFLARDRDLVFTTKGNDFVIRKR